MNSIISNVRKVYNLVIGSKTAEGLKKELGSAVKAEEHFAPGFAVMSFQDFLSALTYHPM